MNPTAEPQPSLSGRRVLITGGGTGLGANLARSFGAAGAEVVIAGRRQVPLEAVATDVPGATAIVADVTDEASVAAMFAAAGPLDIVIANAGAAASAPFTGTTSGMWDEMLAVNLTGVFLTLREAARHMQARQRDTGGTMWGRLITIASTAGLKGYPYVTAYTAAKHGAVGLTRAIAVELASSGITANALCPGYLDTEMTARTIANIVAQTARTHAQARDALTRSNPQRRLIEPGEVTAAALWLCGPGSHAITGQAIAIAGGEL